MQANYQVVILAGGLGTELYPLCEKFPKCLLPINNKPLIVYQLEKLENNGFTISKNSSKIERYLKEQYDGSIKYELVSIPEDKRETCEALKHVANKITDISLFPFKNNHKTLVIQGLNLQQPIDFILIASDSMSDLSLDEVIEQHILSGAYFVAVLKEDKVDEENNKIINPSSLADNHDVFLICEESNKILYVESFYEVKQNGLKVKKQILARNGEASIRTNLVDSHIYICKREVIEVISKLEKRISDQIQSCKDDLLPFLVKNQVNQSLISLFKQATHTIQSGSSQQSDDTSYENKIIDDSNLNQIDSIPILAYITKNNYIKRTNNIKDYIQANFDCIKTDKVMNDTFVNTFQNNSVPLYSSNESDIKINQSNIADKCQIGAKVQITKSIVGQHCEIGEGVKISNCIIMKEVTIEKGCILQNCIISNKSTIKQNSELKDCQIGVNGFVEANTQLTGEVIIQYDN